MSVVADARDASSLRAAVVEAGERWGASQYWLVRLVAELDESHEWVLDGSPTCAHWVADALDIEVCTAREWLRIGRALAALKVIDEAFAQGRLSYSKVRAVTRVATVESNASGRRRHPSTRQKRVVHERDRACRDCGATDLLEYDHEPDYEHSHQTIVDELWSRCWTCHHRRHAKG